MSTRAASPWWRALACAVLLASAGPRLAFAAEAAADIRWRTTDPRAYGYQLGDLVTRQIDIDLPPGLALDAESLPRPGRVNRWFHLRTIERTQTAGRERLHLTWQVTGVRDSAAFVDLPALDLRLRGADGTQPLYIGGRRLAVAPVAPPDAEPELMDDRPARFIDTRPVRLQTLAAATLLALAGAGWLGWRLLLPLLRPARRPFAVAWRALRRQRADASLAAGCAVLHAGFNTSAGHVLLADGLPDFLRERPAFAPLRDDIAAFFAESERLLFAARAPADPVAARAALLRLGRRLRDLERSV